MQASFNTCAGKVTITVEGDTQQELFEALSDYSEVFAHECCGVCKETNIGFLVRMDQEENKYYELKCYNLKCNARLPFGCNKKGGSLFPKQRWNSLSEAEKEKRGPEPTTKGGYLPNGGWFVWKKES